MKITIDVSDFYLEESEGANIEKELKYQIVHEVVQTIKKEIKEKVDTQITTEVRALVDVLMKSGITDMVKEIISEGNIVHNRKLTPVKEVIEYMFEQNSGSYSNANAKEHIEKLAKVYSNEMKNRFDLMFATQIVQKMHEIGLVKDDVAKTLIGK